MLKDAFKEISSRKNNTYFIINVISVDDIKEVKNEKIKFSNIIYYPLTSIKRNTVFKKNLIVYKIRAKRNNRKFQAYGVEFRFPKINFNKFILLHPLEKKLAIYNLKDKSMILEKVGDFDNLLSKLNADFHKVLFMPNNKNFTKQYNELYKSDNFFKNLLFLNEELSISKFLKNKLKCD